MKKIIFIAAVLLVFICLNDLRADNTTKKTYYDQVFAVVNNEAITLNEYKYFVSQYKNRNKTVSDEVIKEIKDKYLKRLIEDILILQAAKEEGFIASPEEVKYYVEQRIEELKKGLKTDENYRKALAKENITEEELKKKLGKDVVKEILRKKIINKEVSSNIVIKDNEINDYYKKISATVSFRDIFTLSRTNAEEVIDSLNNGEDFSELAKKYSKSPESKNGGLMKNIVIKDLSPSLRYAIVDMKEKEYSGIIEAENGYHIVYIEKMTENDSSGTLDLTDEEKKTVRNDIFQKKLAVKLKKWVDTLFDKSYIQIRDYLFE